MDLKSKYKHVLWIGGGTDCGKTTVAAAYAKKLDVQVYHYDRYDVTHHKILAQTDDAVREFMEASFEERWIQQTPESLLQRTLKAFHNRFPMVLSDLDKMDAKRPIIVEGFGLLPTLIAPLLTRDSQALCLVPSRKFKLESFKRRGKPSFKNHVSDPEKGWHNLFTRDMLIVELYRKEAPAYNLRLVEVDSQSEDEMLNLVESHFAQTISRRKKR